MKHVKRLEYLWRGEFADREKYLYFGDELAQKLLMHGGVYFLWKGSVLQYIGQSVKIWRRLRGHPVIGRTKTERAGWVIGIIPEKDIAERLALEGYAIKTFRPPKNKQSFKAKAEFTKIFNLRLQGKTLQAIGDIFGVSRERIRQILNGK